MGPTRQTPSLAHVLPARSCGHLSFCGPWVQGSQGGGAAEPAGSVAYQLNLPKGVSPSPGAPSLPLGV